MINVLEETALSDATTEKLLAGRAPVSAGDPYDAELSTPLDPSAALKRQFSALYGPVAADLAEVEQVLRVELRSQHAYVDQLVKHGFRLGGKRLRPALLLLAGQAVGPVRRGQWVLGAVVEMIHTATLVHDDVLDEAAMRRHLDTVNVRWGNQASVLLGDFLFSHSFYLASTLGDAFACETIGKSTNIVCEGELRQIHSQGNFELSEAEYLAIIDAKTAELCACCCALGSHYSGASHEVRGAMVRYGRNLGIAFQIVDDLLDVLGDEVATGKSLGTDLAQQKLTLPLIRLLSQLSPAARRQCIERLTKESEGRDYLTARPEWNEALAYTRAQAVHHAELARAELACLAPSEARTVLGRLTEFVVERSH